jgi:hypothetical protein
MVNKLAIILQLVVSTWLAEVTNVMAVYRQKYRWDSILQLELTRDLIL